MTRANILALSGGVGGAKLALGLMHTLPAESLTIVANTGDDFTHLGLRICPDIDTLVYTLSDLADKDRGWGRASESWNFMSALKRIGGEDWFNLGDSDMAMHVYRTQKLIEGKTLSEVTAKIANTLGIGPRILPMTNDTVATVVESENGPLPFQHYFVRDRCEPVVTGFQFTGIADATANPDAMALIKNAQLDCIIITPSNPFVSIDPILSLPGMREVLMEQTAPIVAVSPIVGGLAIKGPTAKMMTELGLPSSALAVSEHYCDLLDGMIIDEVDRQQAADIAELGMKVRVSQTVMRTLEDRKGLAQICCDFAKEIAS